MGVTPQLCDGISGQGSHRHQICSGDLELALQADPEQGFEWKQFTWARQVTPVEEWGVEMRRKMAKKAHVIKPGTPMTTGS